MILLHIVKGMLLKGSNDLVVKREASYAQSCAVPYQSIGYKYVDTEVCVFLDNVVKTKNMDVMCHWRFVFQF